MEDALIAQFQNASVESGDDRRYDSDDSIGAFSDEESTPSTTVPSAPAVPLHNGKQTGPKGVIEDQKYFIQAQREAEQKKLAAYHARTLAKAPMTTTYRQDEEARKAAEKSSSRTAHSDTDEDDLDESDEEYQRIRSNRLAELKQEQRQVKARRANQRVFGSVMDVDSEGFTEETEREDDRMIPVVVHLYDDSLVACRRLDPILQALATKFSLAKFLRVSALELEFDLVGSPAILVYRNNDLIVNLVGLTHDISDLSVESIEQLLRGKHALSDSDMSNGTAGQRYDDA